MYGSLSIKSDNTPRILGSHKPHSLHSITHNSSFLLGSVYLHDCTLQGRIPVFLIVFGCFSLLQTCCGVGKMFCCRGNDDENDNQNRRKKGGNFCEGLITTFLFIWVIVGSVYTFGAWNTWVDSGRNDCPGTDCCNPVLMYFAFSTLLLMYGISALCLCCFFCCVCCAMAGSAVSSGAVWSCCSSSKLQKLSMFIISH